MNLPKSLLTKKLNRFDGLIAEGRRILDSAEHVPEERGYNDLMDRSYVARPAFKKLDWPKHVEWRTKAANLLSQVVPKTNVHWEAVEYFPKLPNKVANIEWGISLLTAIKDDLEQGFLDILSGQIEAEVAADYMGQAEGLLTEGASGKFNHVPAAVLSGAVLEKELRTLYYQQQPPIATVDAKDKRMTLAPLIDGLKKAGVFNEAKAKQLRGWAAIRNHAAHGEFDQFTRTDVEQMLQGIISFLGEYRG